MTSNKTRIILLFIWLVFFLLDLVVFLILFFQQYMEWLDLKDALKTLNAIFAPYLGLIIIYFFNRKQSTSKQGMNPVAPTLAILGSGIWNILIFIFLVPLLWLQGTIEDSLEIIENISFLFAWIIAAALGYYFAKDQD